MAWVVIKDRKGVTRADPRVGRGTSADVEEFLRRADKEQRELYLSCDVVCVNLAAELVRFDRNGVMLDVSPHLHSLETKRRLAQS